MRYKGKDRPPLPGIARRLGVDALIEGSVLRVGDRVRITAQLIEAATDEHLWAESYERGLSDILRLQGEVAQAIAREIQVQLTPEVQDRLAHAPSVNADVYRLYLQGRHELNQWSQDSIQKAIMKFDEAIEIDPSYAPAYADLAEAHGTLGYIGFADFPASRERLAKAKTLAVKALELDDSLAEAHSSLAFLKWRLDLDITGAEREHLRALSLSPGSARIRRRYAVHLSAMGRHGEAIATAREAQRLDPLPVSANLHVASALFFARRYDEAIQMIEETRQQFTNITLGSFYLGVSLIEKGRHAEAIEELEQELKRSGGAQLVEAALGYAYASAGQREEAERILVRFKELHRQRQGSPAYIAFVCAGLGRDTEALDWLEKAFEERWGHLMFLKASPVFHRLRSDPRYLDLVRKIGLED
jgi:tetratricopeptide (TPR) repeat protein